MAARSTSPARTTDRIVILGAVLWTVSVAFFVVQGIATGASARPYSLATNLISDLGNTACGPGICSPLHGLVNATFVVVGAFHAIGAVATYRAWPARAASTAGAALLVVAGFGLMLAGLAPENVNVAAHDLGALGGLICLNLGIICLGIAIIEVRRRLGAIAVAAGVAGLIGLAVFLFGRGTVPIGLAERIADYPGAAMIVAFGVTLLLAAATVSRGRREGAERR